MNLKVWEKGKWRNSVRTDETPHYSMVKVCFFIVVRQLNPVDTYRDKVTLYLKTIIQLTARCDIRSNNYNLMTIKGLSGIEITVIGACHYAPFSSACHKWASLFSLSNKKMRNLSCHCVYYDWFIVLMKYAYSINRFCNIIQF